ncbi:MAG: EutN/CcmL family microcompartment protein [Actinobacteria bacterium]|jgi:ethanolamine utilization protein EutN|nr:EutN/CcmL family microcompartment protein [Actinomycetota bacterium]
MELGRVIGSVVSTIKEPSYKGFKLLLVKLIDENFKDKRETYIAVDTIGVGRDEIVILVSGSTARKTEMTKDIMIDLTIVAKVDRINLEK